MVSVTVWNEYRHERENEVAREIHSDGFHETLVGVLSDYGHDGYGPVFSVTEDALWTTLVTEAAIESAQTGKPVSIEVDQ